MACETNVDHFSLNIQPHCLNIFVTALEKFCTFRELHAHDSDNIQVEAQDGFLLTKQSLLFHQLLKDDARCTYFLGYLLRLVNGGSQELLEAMKASGSKGDGCSLLQGKAVPVWDVIAPGEERSLLETDGALKAMRLIQLCCEGHFRPMQVRYSHIHLNNLCHLTGFFSDKEWRVIQYSVGAHGDIQSNELCS